MISVDFSPTESLSGAHTGRAGSARAAASERPARQHAAARCQWNPRARRRAAIGQCRERLNQLSHRGVSLLPAAGHAPLTSRAADRRVGVDLEHAQPAVDDAVVDASVVDVCGCKDFTNLVLVRVVRDIPVLLLADRIRFMTWDIL